MTSKKKTGWVKLPKSTPPECDMCQKVARYFHPLGGLRCAKCPRPETRDEDLPKPFITLGSKLKDLNLPPRVINALMRVAVLTVRDVMQLTPQQLQWVKNFGKGSRQTLRQELAKHGFTLPPDLKGYTEGGFAWESERMNMVLMAMRPTRDEDDLDLEAADAEAYENGAFG